MKMSFFKVLGFMGLVSNWAAESMIPDEDGVVRIDIGELTKLAEAMCKMFGWEAEIVVPMDEE